MDLLAQMATFVKVVETGSLSAAARARTLSLPAVSRQLAALEADLGVSLVARTTRRLGITDAGQRWYAHCLRVLRDVDDSRADVADPRTIGGLLVVSASVTLGQRFVLPLVAPLVKRHPGLAIDLRLEDRVVDLAADAVDIAVRAGLPPPDSPSLISHRFLSFHRIVVAAPAYLRGHGTPRRPDQLASHRCLAQVTDAPAPVWILVRDGTEARVAVRGPLRSTMPAALLRLALDGAGVAFLPSWLVADDVAAGRLRHLMPAWASPTSTAYALLRTAVRTSPRVRAFLAALDSIEAMSPAAIP
jgi:DNA-binding transcriptional LysR family regulator